MKIFKIYDVIISTFLILLFAFLIIVNDDYFEILITGYLVVGGWQIISMLIHAFLKWKFKNNKVRKVYHIIALIFVVTIPGSFWILTVIAPFMAAFYTCLCFYEISLIKERPLALIK